MISTHTCSSYRDKQDYDQILQSTNDNKRAVDLDMEMADITEYTVCFEE